jgi:predicted dehydrogenase
MEYGNGIVGDMCIHMFDMVRWMLGLGWPKRIYSTGGILVQKGGKSNISDTQTATFEYEGMKVVWQHRTWGTSPDKDYPWSAIIYGEKGTLKANTMSYDFIPQGEGKAIHKDCVYEKKEYPEDLKEPAIELNAAAATRGQMKDFLAAIKSGRKPVADIEQVHISTASCILANLSMKLGRPLTYDPAGRKVPGDAEATRLLKRSYRGPWKHPAAALE